MPSGETTVYTGVPDVHPKVYFPRSFHELGQLGTGAAEVAVELTKRGMEELSQGLTKRSATYEGIEEDLGLTKPIMNYSVGLASVLIAATIYEKTTIHTHTPRFEEDRQLGLPLDSLKSVGLSTSRPSSPMRHHSRVGSSRLKLKRED